MTEGFPRGAENCILFLAERQAHLFHPSSLLYGELKTDNGELEKKVFWWLERRWYTRLHLEPGR